MSTFLLPPLEKTGKKNRRIIDSVRSAKAALPGGLLRYNARLTNPTLQRLCQQFEMGDFPLVPAGNMQLPTLNGEAIPAHSGVLSARCPLLLSEECPTGTYRPEVVRFLMVYVYSGRLADQVGGAIAHELGALASSLGLSHLSSLSRSAAADDRSLFSVILARTYEWGSIADTPGDGPVDANSSWLANIKRGGWRKDGEGVQLVCNGRTLWADPVALSSTGGVLGAAVDACPHPAVRLEMPAWVNESSLRAALDYLLGACTAMDAAKRGLGVALGLLPLCRALHIEADKERGDLFTAAESVCIDEVTYAWYLLRS